MWDPRCSRLCAILVAFLVAGVSLGLEEPSPPTTATTTTKESSATNASATTNTNTNSNAATKKKKRGPCATAIDTNNNGNSNSLYATHPVLCDMLDRLEEDAELVASEMTEFARANNLLVGEQWDWNNVNINVNVNAEAKQQQQQQQHQRSRQQALESIVHHQQQPDQPQQPQEHKQPQQEHKQLPVVFAHGMGDSCFNNGMINIGKHTSELLNGVYVTCIPTGDTKTEDTTNGYFMNMNESVDVFASKVAKDPNLAGGFHAVGFSQGNNVIRGYVARYNTHAAAPTNTNTNTNNVVHTFLSVNGVNAGEGTVPGCFPKKDGGTKAAGLGSFCDLLLEQASDRAYTEFAQKHSFQSNYWRDPRESKMEDYHKHSQLARWNNEGPGSNYNQTLVDNFARTSKFVWVKATRDSMVWPSEGEHWGCPDPTDPFRKPVRSMNQTEWYQKDLFGLKTAQEAGKNVFETFEGDHLQFTMEDFDRWIVAHLKANGGDNGNGKNNSNNSDIDIDNDNDNDNDKPQQPKRVVQTTTTTTTTTTTGME